MPAHLLPDTPQRLLVRGVNWLGDAVMTTPALARLRERFATARITLLTPDKLADLWLHHPGVDSLVTFRPRESVFSIVRRLRPERFDLALILPNSPRSAIESWLTRIPCRVGYGRGWRRVFLTHPVATRADHVKMRKRQPDEIRRLISDPNAPRRGSYADSRQAHQVHEYLQLAARLGADLRPLTPALKVVPEELSTVRRKFGLPEHCLWLGLNPGAEYGPAKRWPVGHFITAARAISAETGARWIIFGGKNDAELTQQIAAGLGEQAIDLAGRTTLRELMALSQVCRVYLTNDTGPMHVAAALGTPVVALFGSTSPELTCPGNPEGHRHRLLVTEAPCSPCFLRDCPIDLRCLTSLSPAAAVDAVKDCLIETV